jgi:hypothetical protein
MLETIVILLIMVILVFSGVWSFMIDILATAFALAVTVALNIFLGYIRIVTFPVRLFFHLIKLLLK